MNKKILALITFTASIVLCYGQNNVPVLKTNKKVLDIRENGKLDKGGWEVVKVEPFDLYEVGNKNTKQRITLYSEIDSLQFDIEPNRVYDFVIVYNDTEKFLSRISTKYNNYKKECSSCEITSDTIPFELGRDNRILIKGSINKGATLNFQFDTGAEGNWLYESGVKKYPNLIYSSEGISEGQGGVIKTKNSLNNRLDFSKLIWDNIRIDNLGLKSERYDGGIGYKIFEGKILEINYDKSILIAHTNLPKNINEYTKCNFRKIGGLYFIELTLIVNGKEITAWYDFDTGNTYTLSLQSAFVKENPSFSSLKKLGEATSTGIGPQKVYSDKVSMPIIKIGGEEIKAFPVLLQKNETLAFNICGSEILKRFNIIVDYPNEKIYLKRNNLFNTPIKEKSNEIFYLVSIISLISIILVIVFIVKRKKAIR
jgi:hypothetical protein